MAKIYDKPVWQLLLVFADERISEHNPAFHLSEAVSWFESKYPLIKNATIKAHLIKMSTNAKGRVGWKPRPHHNVFFALGQARYRRYDQAHDPPPIMRTDDIADLPASFGTITDDVEDEDGAEGSTTEFAYERDLQNFLVKNLDLVEEGLKLYEDEGITGVEYPVGGRRIDILAVDIEGALVVIELKVSRGHDRVVGQILRYLGWIKQNLAEEGQHVRGIIVAKEITEDLQLACMMTTDISLREYSISFSVNQVN